MPSLVIQGFGSAGSYSQMEMILRAHPRDCGLGPSVGAHSVASAVAKFPSKPPRALLWI